MAATKTLKNSWIEQLSKILTTNRRIAFVGVGQELRGDDAAGILAIRRLEQSLASAGASDSETIPSTPPSTGGAAYSNKKVRAFAPFLFEAGPLPEASAGPLRRFGPERVIFLDAADMGEAPGAIGWIEPDRIGGCSASTHTFPMSGFSRYLTSELGCQVAVLGIQPKQLDFDTPVSEEILRAIEEITAVILTESNANK
jgi:hydrogenase maturation protease